MRQGEKYARVGTQQRCKTSSSFSVDTTLHRLNRSRGNIPVVSSSGINSYHSESKADGPGVVIGRKGTLGDGPLPGRSVLAARHDLVE